MSGFLVRLFKYISSISSIPNYILIRICYYIKQHNTPRLTVGPELPIDIYVQIFKHVPYTEYSKLARGCKQFNQALQHELVWDHIGTVYALSGGMRGFREHVENYWKWDLSGYKHIMTKWKPHAEGYTATPLDPRHRSFTMKITNCCPLVGIVNEHVRAAKGEFEKGSIMLTCERNYSVDYNCQTVKMDRVIKVQHSDRIKFRMDSGTIEVFINNKRLCEVKDETELWYPLFVTNGDCLVTFI